MRQVGTIKTKCGSPAGNLQAGKNKMIRQLNTIYWKLNNSGHILPKSVACSGLFIYRLYRRLVMFSRLVQPFKTPMHPIMAELFDTNPYKRFYRWLAYDKGGWGSNRRIFKTLVEELKPELIIEVGTWKGGSAISIGTCIKELKLRSHILCIDTWLGSVEHWEKKHHKTKRFWYTSLNLKNGYPQVYYQFIANVIYNRLQDVIIPFPTTSLSAAKWLHDRNITADLIYIDAGHQEDEVYQDLTKYFDILKRGGVIIGDDLKWEGVAKAVDRFTKERDIRYEVIENELMWLIRKHP